MGLVMTNDGHVRPLRLEDLKEVAERDERIQQLERQCVALAEQVDRMTPVVNATKTYVETGMVIPLLDAYNHYRQQMAQLVKESG